MKDATREKLEALNIKQRNFVINYTDKSKDTFNNQHRSFMASGYKFQGSKPSNQRRRASEVYATPRVKEAIMALLEEKEDIQLKNEALSLAMLDAELFSYLDKCKAEGDRTNTAAALRLIGQRLSAYTDKQLNATIEPPAVIEDIDATIAECKAAKDAISRNIKLATG